MEDKKYYCTLCGAEVENPGTLCNTCFQKQRDFDREYDREQEEERRKQEENR